MDYTRTFTAAAKPKTQEELLSHFDRSSSPVTTTISFNVTLTLREWASYGCEVYPDGTASAPCGEMLEALTAEALKGGGTVTGKDAKAALDAVKESVRERYDRSANDWDGRAAERTARR